MLTYAQYVKNRRLVEAEVGQHVLLYDGIGEQFHALNLGGMIVWRMLDTADLFAEVTDKLAEWFGAAPERSTLESNVDTFLKHLVSLGLLIDGANEPPGKWNKEVSLVPHACKPPYEAPNVRTYSKDWIKENHPAAFYEVAFSDTWSPGCDTPTDVPV